MLRLTEAFLKIAQNEREGPKRRRQPHFGQTNYTRRKQNLENKNKNKRVSQKAKVSNRMDGDSLKRRVDKNLYAKN